MVARLPGIADGRANNQEGSIKFVADVKLSVTNHGCPGVRTAWTENREIGLRMATT